MSFCMQKMCWLEESHRGCRNCDGDKQHVLLDRQGKLYQNDTPSLVICYFLPIFPAICSSFRFSFDSRNTAAIMAEKTKMLFISNHSSQISGQRRTEIPALLHLFIARCVIGCDTVCSQFGPGCAASFFPIAHPLSVAPSIGTEQGNLFA